MPTVKQIYEFINSLAPFATQESWDNSGLLLGNPDKEVSRVSLALDATAKTVKAAKENGMYSVNSADNVIQMKYFHLQKRFSQAALFMSF